VKPEQLAASIWIHLAKCYGLVLLRVRRAETRLTLPQIDVLAQLLRNGPMTPGDLSRELLVTAGNITGIIARLRGLVARTSHPQDGRAAVLRLTVRGRRVAQREIARHVRLLPAVFRGLSPSRQREVRKSLQTLLHALENGR
jgi:DNA-binding MarR family transcriptional regulator